MKFDDRQREQAVNAITPLYAQLGKRWKQIASQLEAKFPGITSDHVRDWYRHDYCGAKDTWDSAREAQCPRSLNELFADTRDEFEEIIADLIAEGRLVKEYDVSLENGLKQTERLIKVFREFGAVMQKPTLGKLENDEQPEPTNVVGIEERLREIKDKMA